MSNDERDETQRLREANAVLMEAVEHYADKTRWRVTPCDSLLQANRTARERCLARICINDDNRKQNERCRKLSSFANTNGKAVRIVLRHLPMPSHGWKWRLRR